MTDSRLDSNTVIELSKKAPALPHIIPDHVKEVVHLLEDETFSLSTEPGKIPKPGALTGKDKELLSIIEAKITLRIQSTGFVKRLQKELLHPRHIASFSKEDVESSQCVVHALRSLEDFVESRLRRHTDLGETHTTPSKVGTLSPGEGGIDAGAPTPRPRLLRLAKTYGMTRKECEAFGYLLLCHLGRGFPANVDGYRDLKEGSDATALSTVASFTDMTTEEMLNFVSPSRLYRREGILEVYERKEHMASHMILKISNEVMRALIGGELSESEFLKIDSTALARLLRMEEGFSLRTPPHGPSKPRLSVDEIPAFDLGEPADETLNLKNMLSLAENQQPVSPSSMTHAPPSTLFPTDTLTADKSSGPLEAYTSDVEYLDDRMKLIANKFEIRKQMETARETRGHKAFEGDDMVLRQLRTTERMLTRKCERRLKLTRVSGDWRPRLERLGLDPFEKLVIVTLVGSKISHDVRRAARDAGMTRGGIISFDVGTLLWILCPTFDDQIRARQYFLRNSTLMRRSLVALDDHGSTDLFDMGVDIDRLMLEFVLGLDTDMSDLLTGSRLFQPKVTMEQVYLTNETKKLIVQTVDNSVRFQKHRKQLGLDDALAFPIGLCMLFFGPSGTGKTMMAQAVASYLEKKLMILNVALLEDHDADYIKFIFREAKSNDAVLFFDECESLLNDKHSRASFEDSATLWDEIEKHHGIIIMATNRSFELDDSMHRRITLAVDFPGPNPLLREKIWESHLPPTVKLGDDVSWKDIAVNYEMTGGIIKNALVSAISFALARREDDAAGDVILIKDDLEQACKLHLRGHLQIKNEDRPKPSSGLSSLVCSESTRQKLQDVLDFSKAKKVLLHDWGFSETSVNTKGITVVFHGGAGTGKSHAASCLGFELGKRLEVISPQVLARFRGDIDAIFKVASSAGSILVFEDAEGLFAESRRGGLNYAAVVDPTALLNEITSFTGLCILITTQPEAIDPTFAKQVHSMVPFSMPSDSLRQQLWDKQINSKVPLGDDVNTGRLAKDFELTGGQIMNVIFKAASRAAIKPEDARAITHHDFVQAAEEELLEARRVGKYHSMYR